MKTKMNDNVKGNLIAQIMGEMKSAALLQNKSLLMKVFSSTSYL